VIEGNTTCVHYKPPELELVICPEPCEITCGHDRPHRKCIGCTEPSLCRLRGDSPCVPYKPEARKISESTIESERTSEHGQVPNGKKPSESSSKTIQTAGIAEIKVRFPITRTLRFTENQSTSYLQASGVYVTSVTLDYTPGSSCVLDVREFLQNQMVNDAFLALINPILKELSITRNIDSESETNQTKHDAGSSTRKKKSKTGSG
jgi:hypothetical protein